jgi:hypothetical protein
MALKSVSREQWLAKVQGGDPSMQELDKRRAEYPLLDRVCQFLIENYDSLEAERKHVARGWLQMTDWLTQIAEEQPRYDVFLSYAHKDATLAQELRDALKMAGRSCFMAEKDIPVATEWEREIHGALLGCSFFLVLLTPNSKDSAWVLLESGGAWILGKKVIPALAYVDPSSLPDPIRRFQARHVQSPQQIQELIRQITGVSAQQQHAADGASRRPSC